MRTMLPDLKEIRIKRRALNLTQKELADLVELSRSTIAKIENEKLDPSYSNAKKIFEALNHLERQKTIPQELENITLGDIHASPVTYASASQSIYDVWIQMVETTFSQFPVESDGQIIGSITERAITKAILEKTLDNPGEQPISKIIEEPFPTLNVTTPLSLVSSLIMHTEAVLTQKNSDIIGIITKNDIGKVLKL